MSKSDGPAKKKARIEAWATEKVAPPPPTRVGPFTKQGSERSVDPDRFIRDVGENRRKTSLPVKMDVVSESGRYERKKRTTSKNSETKRRPEVGSLGTKNTTRKIALKTFGKTVKEPKMLGQLLGNLCSSDSGSCLTFGKYVKPIKKLFNQFTFFKYAFPVARRIGTPSANGFVYEITYETQGIRAHTILKCSLPPDHPNQSIDGLYYEYLVGQLFVNDCYNRFPCFLETYGVYHMNRAVVADISTKKTYNISDLKDKLNRFKPMTYDDSETVKQQLRMSCENQFDTCILIQHISSSDSMESYFKKNTKKKDYFCFELPHLLYQVYAPLAILGDTFTHYDLHRDNVLLYNIGRETYIQMNYIFPHGTTVSFKTHLICKIIDYGRSYFYANDKVNSQNVYEKVCDACIDKEDPGNECGNDNGYAWFNADDPLEDSYYIRSSIPNVSHDLRLLNDFKIDPKRALHVNYSCGITKVFDHLYYEEMYGTPSHPESVPGRIYNIMDAEVRLRELVLEPTFTAANDAQYKSCACVGTLDIYIDPSSKKSMGFEPVY